MINPWALLAIIAGCVGIFISGYLKGSSATEEKYQLAEREALIKYAETIKKSQETHDADQIVISTLTSRLNRVRVHVPTNCPTTSKDSSGNSGVFSDSVDAAFAKLQSGVNELAARCDQLNIDAIRLNSSISK
jgi:hypothetical protein